MYDNLMFEMQKNGITKRAIARHLNIHENSVANKFSGKSKWTIEEAFDIKEEFFPDKDLLYLFETA